MSIINFGALAGGKNPGSVIENAVARAFSPAPTSLQAELAKADGLSPVVKPVATMRRRRLWELPHKTHCPIIGVCFDVNELRQMIGRVLNYPADTTDYVWHTIAVGICDERCPLSEKFNKLLDRRYGLMIKRLAACKTGDELRLAWQTVCKQGIEIPAGLWATCTHPACTGELELEIHADIHMIQHQVGAGLRADHAAMKALQAENAELRRELELARSRYEQQRGEHQQVAQKFSLRLLEMQTDQAAREALIARQAQEIESLRQALPDLQDRQRLIVRLQAAEQRLSLMKEREKAQAKEIGRLQDFAKYAEETIESLTQAADAPDLEGAMPDGFSDEALLGKCVLCVGGRSGAVNSYREVVENKGGRFMHHDGGREENIQRIDGALAAADIVICQVGCISHNAYWRVKEQCKRTGKPCMFVKNAGLTSFGRIVGEVGKKTSEPGAS